MNLWTIGEIIILEYITEMEELMWNGLENSEKIIKLNSEQKIQYKLKLFNLKQSNSC